MNREANRKRHERYLLERFLAATEISAEEIIDSESPDFLLRIASRRIGVEVTEIFAESPSTGPSPRAKENITDRIVAEAKRHYHAMNGGFVHVTVLFFDGVDLQSLHRQTVARRIAALVRDMQPGTIHKHWRNDYEDETLDAIAFVTALAVPEAAMAHWSVARAGWRLELPLDLINKVIKTKNTKAASYRTKAEEVWLLLAVDGSRPSQFFDADKPPPPDALRSQFDRTYLYNAMHNQVVCWSGSSGEMPGMSCAVRS